jgi:hypothetical protein
VRLIRLLALIAVVLTLPLYGVAFAAPARLCAPHEAPSVSAETRGECCNAQAHAQRSSTNTGADCLGAACHCATGCAQSQAFDRPALLMPVFLLTSDRAISRVATLMTADSPQGLWRPPRAL